MFLWLPNNSRWATSFLGKVSILTSVPPKFGVGIHLLYTQVDYPCSKNLKSQSLFHCFSPSTSADPRGRPCCLGVPSSDVKIRPWLVCKATFKRAAHTHKPTRDWQLPFLMAAHLCKEENGTWTQSSRDAEKISQCDQRMDVPLNPLHSWMRLTPRLRDHWSFQITLQPIHLPLLPKNQPRAIFTPATPF